MSASTFIDRVRIAASPFSPEAWDDPTRLLTSESARAKEFEDIWLAPVTVRGFQEADFASLPTADRDRLRAAVRAFREVSAKVVAEVAAQTRPGTAATDEQVAAGSAAFADILAVVKPYLADAEGLAVRRAIWAGCEPHRDLVLTFDFEFTDDLSGNPSVRVWLVLNDDVDLEARATQLRLYVIRDAIRGEFDAAGIRRQLYASVWSRSGVPEVMKWEAV